MRRSLLLGVAAAAVLVVGCAREATDNRPGQPVASRQKAFKAMLREFEPMGVMLRQGPFDAQRFAEHWRRFAPLVDQPWAHFREDTCYPPAKVTPQACADWPGLLRAADTFRGASATLGEAVAALERASGGAAAEAAKAAVEQAYARVYDACQECHRVYRKK